MQDVTWRPADEATTADVEAVFATGGAAKCRCQAMRVPGWIWRDTTQEGYTIEPAPGATVIWDEASVGLLQVFLSAGYEVVASPTLRRRVVRRVLSAPG